MNNGERRGKGDKFSVEGSFFTGLSPAAHVSTEVTLFFHAVFVASVVTQCLAQVKVVLTVSSWPECVYLP